MSQTKSTTAITEVGRVVVPVTDQDRALDFYVTTLGFEKRADIPMGDGSRWIEVAPEGAPTALALFPPREGEPIGVNTGVTLTTEDVERDHAYLLAQGVDADAEVMRMGGPVPPMFSFRDPDGNRLAIVQPE